LENNNFSNQKQVELLQILSYALYKAVFRFFGTENANPKQISSVNKNRFQQLSVSCTVAVVGRMCNGGLSEPCFL
jgi:hypothetical protein